MLRKSLTLILIVVLLSTSVGLWQVLTFLYQPAGLVGTEAIVDVVPGASLRQITKKLVEKKILIDDRKFSLMARLLGYANRLRVGEYALNGDMTPMKILKVLSSGKSIEKAFTVQEGLNMFEIAASYEAKGFGSKNDFLKWAQDSKFIKELLGEKRVSLEGYLFPETYLLTKFTTTKKLIQLMVQNFKRAYAGVQGVNRFNLNRHEIVTLASIIEKETGAPEERPLISSVFHNRLRKKMRLESDPTIMYGILDETKKMVKNIRKSDIRRPTRYNTYTVKGLPYGPIANPGKEALQATVKPETSEFLYFVSRNDGTHVFSSNYKDHSRAVVKWQKTRKNRTGRSWRDRYKEK